MLSLCTRICTLMVLLSSSAQANSVVIRGNAYGLWSPTHPHLTSGRSKPNSPVLYEPPPPQEPVTTESEVTSSEEVEIKSCPTILSAPHLCTPEQLEASG